MSHKGCTLALERSIEKGDLSAFASLLCSDIDVKTPLGPDGWPPLCCAVARDRQEFVTLLLKHGADPNQAVQSGPAQGMVPLSFCRQLPIAIQLVNIGARPDLRDCHDLTPLDWARITKHQDIVSYLQRFFSAGDSMSC